MRAGAKRSFSRFGRTSPSLECVPGIPAGKPEPGKSGKCATAADTRQKTEDRRQETGDRRHKRHKTCGTCGANMRAGSRRAASRSPAAQRRSHSGKPRLKPGFRKTPLRKGSSASRRPVPDRPRQPPLRSEAFPEASPPAVGIVRGSPGPGYSGSGDPGRHRIQADAVQPQRRRAPVAPGADVPAGGRRRGSPIGQKRPPARSRTNILDKSTPRASNPATFVWSSDRSMVPRRNRFLPCRRPCRRLPPEPSHPESSQRNGAPRSGADSRNRSRKRVRRASAFCSAPVPAQAVAPASGTTRRNGTPCRRTAGAGRHRRKQAPGPDHQHAGTGKETT